MCDLDALRRLPSAALVISGRLPVCHLIVSPFMLAMVLVLQLVMQLPVLAQQPPPTQETSNQVAPPALPSQAASIVSPQREQEAQTRPITGDNPAFSYTPSAEDPSVSIVSPAGGAEPIQVSTSFLKLVLRNQRADDTQRLKMLSEYPRMTEQTYNSMATSNYPDASSQAANTVFQDVTIKGTDQSAILTQDPLAAPYVRVSIVDRNGKVTKEFSISKAIAQSIVSNTQQPEAQKVIALQQFPFPLPEKARENFAELKSDKIMDLAYDLPTVKKQEIVKMHRFYSGKPIAPDSGGSKTTETATAENSTRPRSSPNASSNLAQLPSSSKQQRSSGPASDPVSNEVTKRETRPLQSPDDSDNPAARVLVIAAVIGMLILGAYLFSRKRA